MVWLNVDGSKYQKQKLILFQFHSFYMILNFYRWMIFINIYNQIN